MGFYTNVSALKRKWSVATRICNFYIGFCDLHWCHWKHCVLLLCCPEWGLWHWAWTKAQLGLSSCCPCQLNVSSATVRGPWGLCKILVEMARGEQFNSWAGREESLKMGTVQLLTWVFAELGAKGNVQREVISGLWSRRAWNLSADLDLWSAFKPQRVLSIAQAVLITRFPCICTASLGGQCILSTTSLLRCIMKVGAHWFSCCTHPMLPSQGNHLWSLTSTWADGREPNLGWSELFYLNSNPRCLLFMQWNFVLPLVAILISFPCWLTRDHVMQPNYQTRKA